MPTQYQIPSWLDTKPDDVANKFATGLQIGAQLGEARNRLQQQAQQSAVENQVTQDKLAASLLQQQQELNVKKAYEDQQVSLAQQKIQAAQQKVGLETVKAARQFQAQQAYQKDYQAGLDMGLPQDEAARGSYFKNLVQFGSPSGAASAMRPNVNKQASIPETMDVNDITGKAHRYIYRGPGSTMHEVGATSSKPDPFSMVDYRALGAQKKALIAQRIDADRLGVGASRTNSLRQIDDQIKAIDNQMSQVKGGNAASSGSPIKFRRNPQTGALEMDTGQASQDNPFDGEE